MKLLETLKRVSQLRLGSIDGKGAALFLLNRRLPELVGNTTEFGRMTDLRLDRRAHSIAFDISREREVHTITVRGYRLFTVQQRSYLGWSSLRVDGPAREHYSRAFHGIERIEVPRRYVFMLEALL